MRRSFRNQLRILTAVMLCIGLLGAFAAGYEQVDTKRPTAVTLRYAYGETPLEGMELTLYQVAELEKNGSFLRRKEFDAGGVDLTAQEPKWADMAATLAAFVQANGTAVEPCKVVPQKTAQDGSVRFSELSAGLYLVMGKTLRIGNDAYSPVPFLLTLPQLTEEDCWDYDAEITVEQKVSHTHNSNEKKTLTVTAEKFWVGDDGASRPAEVKVTLLKNGVPYETVSLDEAHHWKHTWRGLSRKEEWTLTEEVPDGYTVLIEKNATASRIAFVVTNTSEVPPPPSSTPPSTPSVPPSTPPDTPSIPPSTPPSTPTIPPSNPPVSASPPPSVLPSAAPSTEPMSSVPTSQETVLPQTGLLWWPIWLLGGVGLGFVTIGLVFTRKREENG